MRAKVFQDTQGRATCAGGRTGDTLTRVDDASPAILSAVGALPETGRKVYIAPACRTRRMRQRLRLKQR